MAKNNIMELLTPVNTSVGRTLQFNSEITEKFWFQLSELDREIIRQLCQGVAPKRIAVHVNRSDNLVRAKIKAWRSQLNCPTNIAFVNFLKQNVNECRITSTF